jgi:hypothetical protein
MLYLMFGTLNIYCYVSILFSFRSLARVGVGHRVYISGLTCNMNSQRM